MKYGLPDKQDEKVVEQKEEVKTDGYQENPEVKDFPEFDLVYARWNKRNQLKDPTQIRMYRAIANKWAVGKTVLDAGCGMGIGTNILGWHSIGAYGVDSNKETVKLAQQLYEAPRVRFQYMDLTEGVERPTATFDIVCAIEVIEHIDDYEKALEILKRFWDHKRRTIFFISSPNRNSDKLAKDKPRNKHHVREWTAGEFYEILTKHFKNVVMYSGEKLDTFSLEETVDGSTKDSPILAKCENPIFEEGAKIE